MLRILVVGLIMLVAAMALMPRRSVPPPENATEWPQQRALPIVALRDHTGAEFSTAELTDRFSLLFFGFANCPDICPASLAVLAQASERLAAARTPVPRVVLLSVDPARDTPEQLRRYLARFDDEFIGATAEMARLEPLLTALGVTVMRQSLGAQQYNMTHNPQVYVIAPNGNVIATLSSASSADAVVRDYQRIRARFLSGASAAAPPQ
ncbi:MAG TPA: SCO family protein [Gammaproteobacteria bacterium]|nr:SCO family protein [Gammaproteobacteria bacterium]